MDAATMVRKMVVDSIARRGNSKAELTSLWKSVRQEASQTPNLKNPISSQTDHYQNRLNETASMLLENAGVKVEFVSGYGYPCVRIHGIEITY